MATPNQRRRSVTTINEFVGPEIDRQEKAWRADNKSGCLTVIIVATYPTGSSGRDASAEVDRIVDELRGSGAAQAIVRTKQFFDETEWERL